MGVTVGGLDLEHAFADFQNRNIKGAAAQVKHRDLFLAAFVQTVGQGCCRGFVDDAQHIQTGNLAGVLGRLALAVIEVGGHGHHRIGYGFAQVFLGGLFDVGQYIRGYFRRAREFAPQVDTHVAVVSLLNLVGQNFDVALHLG